MMFTLRIGGQQQHCASYGNSAGMAKGPPVTIADSRSYQPTPDNGRARLSSCGSVQRPSLDAVIASSRPFCGNQRSPAARPSYATVDQHPTYPSPLLIYFNPWSFSSARSSRYGSPLHISTLRDVDDFQLTHRRIGEIVNVPVTLRLQRRTHVTSPCRRLPRAVMPQASISSGEGLARRSDEVDTTTTRSRPPHDTSHHRRARHPTLRGRKKKLRRHRIPHYSASPRATLPHTSWQTLPSQWHPHPLEWPPVRGQQQSGPAWP